MPYTDSKDLHIRFKRMDSPMFDSAMDNLGKNIKMFLAEEDMTSQELSQLTGTKISAVIKGVLNPSLYALVRISFLTGKTLDELTGMKDA